MRKKLAITALVCLVLLVSAIGAIHGAAKPDVLRILVLHAEGRDTYLDALQHLRQTLVVGVETEAAAWPVSDRKLKSYSAVYLDRSLGDAADAGPLSRAMERYVDGGGLLFAENALHQALSPKLIGAKELAPVTELPAELSLPEADGNAGELQKVVGQFHRDLAMYYNKERLAKLELGTGVVPSTARKLAAGENGVALYTLNRYGKGAVLFAGGLLPGNGYATGFDLQPREGEGQPYFNFTFAAGGYQLRNAFADFVSKEKRGYSIQKVLGTNGRPAMAWQNHFEVGTSVRDGGMEKWIDYLKDYDQIPSFSLARETYEWGVWKEGLVYHPNVGTDEEPAYQGENVHSQYASGHIAQMEGGGPFVLEAYPEFKSLSEKLELPYRAYVDALDVNGDGIADLIVGSASGEVRLYEGSRSELGWRLGSGRPATLAGEEPLRLDGYAAPAAADLNGDGRPDLIVGDGSGRLRIYLNEGGFSFRELDGAIPDVGAGAYAAPAIGDLNGDGVGDLVVGTGDGRLLFVAGSVAADGMVQWRGPVAELEAVMPGAETGTETSFAAPRIADYDGDGRAELLVGDNDGFIRIWTAEAGEDGQITLTDGRYAEGETLNPFGDHRLWAGRNAVPALADIDGDGTLDLLAGGALFGFPTAVDDPQYPYREQLERALAYAQSFGIEIQPHLFFHSYESSELEAEEIELHRQAFEAYGLPWEPVGTNQHTWRINNLVPDQTLRTEMASGIWWNSGFRPAGNPYEPTLAGEYLWTMPFLLASGERTEPFVVANPAPNMAVFEETFQSYAALDMPLTYFYHMEYPILKRPEEAGYAEKVQFLDRFRDDHDYNFMTEEEMFRSYMAVFQARSELDAPLLENVSSAIQNRIRTKKQLAVTVRTAGLRKMDWATAPDSKLQEKVRGYLPAVGYKAELGARYKGYVPATDAPIAMYRGKTLYFGGVEEARLTLRTEMPDEPRIERANMPVKIEHAGEELRIAWSGKGMQQIKLYAPGGLEIASEGWKQEAGEDGSRYVLTRYGDATELAVRLK